MRVHVVDPSAYTPPYDHALCAALARTGAQVELITSSFAYGAVPQPDGYRRRELFYRAAVGRPGGPLRTALKLCEHVPDMLRYRRVARSAEVVHFQWLSMQHVDGALLVAKRRPGGKRRALVLTAHDILPREPRLGQLRAQRRLYGRFDALVVHSEHGARRLTEQLGVPAERVHVIPHGVFTYLAEAPGELPSELAGASGQVVLCFGLMRPYKGLAVLIEAWRRLAGSAAGGEAAGEGAQLQRAASGARHRPQRASPELWLVGMPRMNIDGLRRGAPPGVRWVTRFVSERELAGCFERADLVVLPYLQADQSGVLFTALAFGKPLLLSDVGGFPEMGDTRAAKVVPAGDPAALAHALRELLAGPDALERMRLAAHAAAQGRHSWDSIARAHLELYESLL